MRLRHALLGLMLAAAAGAFMAPSGVDARDAAVRHITMDGSFPADGEKLSSVNEVRLFFSGAPLMRGASVRIVTSSRELVRTPAPAPDPTDPKQLFVPVEQALAPGTYVVQWRCIADDGHVMRGDFRFEVAAEAE